MWKPLALPSCHWMMKLRSCVIVVTPMNGTNGLDFEIPVPNFAESGKLCSDIDAGRWPYIVIRGGRQELP